MDIVIVEWTDAQEETGALSFDDAKQEEGVPSRTVGFLIEKTNTKVIISATQYYPQTNGEHYRATWTIPMGCIKKIKKLGKV